MLYNLSVYIKEIAELVIHSANENPPRSPAGKVIAEPIVTVASATALKSP